MGLDMTYRAIAPGTVLHKIVSGDPQAAFYFGLYGYRELPEYAAHRPELAEYRAEAEKIQEDEDHPGIEDRHLDLYRHWDMLHYLLSDIRRQDVPYDENDLMYKAINGGAKMGAEFVMPQGVPITYLTPDEVRDISNALQEITPDMLRENWNPEAMREAGVYKIRGDEGEGDLEYLLEDLGNLSHFYLMATVFDEGVLVFCD